METLVHSATTSRRDEAEETFRVDEMEKLMNVRSENVTAAYWDSNVQVNNQQEHSAMKRLNLDKDVPSAARGHLKGVIRQIKSVMKTLT